MTSSRDGSDFGPLVSHVRARAGSCRRPSSRGSACRSCSARDRPAACARARRDRGHRRRAGRARDRALVRPRRQRAARSPCSGLFIGWSFIGVGLFAWWRRPDNRFGVLMTAVGFAFFLGVADRGGLRPGCSRSACSSRASTSRSSCTCCSPIPTGGSTRRGCASVLAGGYALVDLGPLPALLFADPSSSAATTARVGDLPRRRTRSSTTSSTRSISAIAVVLVGYVLYVLVHALAGRDARRSGARWRRCCGRASACWSCSPAQLTTQARRRAGRARGRRRRARADLLRRHAVRRSCSGCCARASSRRARCPSCCAGWATRPTATQPARAARRRRSATARSRSSTGSTIAARWVDAAGPPAELPDDDDPARAWTPVEREGRARRRDRPRPLARATTPSWSRSVAVAAGPVDRERAPAGAAARPRRGAARVARADRRGRHGRAAAARAQPARRRPAAARRALAHAAARPGPAAQGPRRRREAARRRPGGARAARSRSCASSRAASIRPCSPTAGSRRRSRRSPGRSPVPVELDGTPPERLPAAGRGGGLLRRRRGADERRQVRRRHRRRACRSRAATATPSSRSPTTASAAPIRAADRVCAGSPTASPRSTAGWS